MNILLLNDNPVVTKLVTLSAQKTSDELDIVSSIDEIAQKPYDLFVLDDALYSDDIISVVKAKTSFSSSLYICSRDAEEVLGFTQTLKKPFLPTDLVEIFAKASKEAQSPAPVVEDSFDSDDAEIVEIESEDEFVEEEQELAEEMEVEEVQEIIADTDEESLEIDGLEDFEFDDELEDTLGEDLEDLEDIGIDEDLGESILDKDDVQEVQNLLDEVDVEFTYDVDKVAGELSFSPDALKEFLEDFIAQAEEFRAQLYGALDLSDYETIHSIAHKLKGVAANLSVTEAFDSLVVVNQSEDNDEIKTAIDRYYVIIAKLNEYIHKPEDDMLEEEMIEEDSSDTVLDVEELEDFNDDDLLLEEDLSDEILELEELEADEAEEELEVEEEPEEELSLEEEVDMPEMELEDEIEELAETLELDETEELEVNEDIAVEKELEEVEELEVEEELELEEEIQEDELKDEEEDILEMELDEEIEEVEESLELEELEELEPEEELETEEESLEELDTESVDDMLEMELDEEIEEVDESLELEETQELEAEEEVEIEEELEPEEEIEESDLETQIESAVSELSEDDLASELDADSILDISVDDVDGLDALDTLDSLSSADIKSAIGEDDAIEVQETPEIQTLEEAGQEPDNDGVEALKTLLTALSDKNVVASLKGMKININITLGDK